MSSSSHGDEGRDLALSTRLLHHSRNLRAGSALNPAVVFASTFHSPETDGALSDTYGRTDNSTWRAYERALSLLEGGDALVFPSGMAAIVAVFQTFVPKHGVLAIASDGYYLARQYAHEASATAGYEVREFRTCDALSTPLDGVDLVLIETPANPSLEMCDIRALANRCERAGAILAVDNTLATPMLQRPLEEGAHMSIASDTKAIAGHSDLILGHVAAKDSETVRALRAYRNRSGAVAGPMEVWLAYRSLATLDIRLERQCNNAQALVEALRTSEVDVDVHAAQIAGRTLPVIGLDFRSRERARRFLESTQLIIEATSFGGVHTTAERRARWNLDGVGPGFVRLSVGCEDRNDLLADVARGLLA